MDGDCVRLLPRPGGLVPTLAAATGFIGGRALRRA
jgi:hypothetical protein